MVMVMVLGSASAVAFGISPWLQGLRVRIAHKAVHTCSAYNLVRIAHKAVHACPAYNLPANDDLVAPTEHLWSIGQLYLCFRRSQSKTMELHSAVSPIGGWNQGSRDQFRSEVGFLILIWRSYSGGIGQDWGCAMAIWVCNTVLLFRNDPYPKRPESEESSYVREIVIPPGQVIP